jgi:hypothetical protein
MALKVLITDAAHNVVGDPLDEWSSIDVTTRFNEPASGQITHPAHAWVVAQLQPGNRVVLIRDGAVWCEGPLEVPQEYTWDLTDDAEPGTVTLSFSDDLAVLAGFVTWADPTQPWYAQPLKDNYTASGNSETLIRDLVDTNCGPGALSSRQIPGLALAPAALVGTDTTVTTRFEGLLEACRRAALNGGGLGFRTYVNGAQILFETYQPADLTATARFAKGLGNLRSVSYKLTAPTVTDALVAGTYVEADPDADPPTAASRVFLDYEDSSLSSRWWRVEQYIDGSAEDDSKGELTEAAKDALSTGGESVELSTTTVDTEDLKAGRDYGLGDLVTVVLPTGLEVADIVRSIHLQATPESGEYVSSLIGSSEATTTPASVRVIQDLSRRLGRIAAR